MGVLSGNGRGVCRRIGVGLLGLFMLQACGRRPRVPVDPGPVCSALLAELSRQFAATFPEDEREEVFLVEPDAQPLWPGQTWEMLKKGLPSLRRETYEDLLVQNEKPILPTFTAAGDRRIDVADRKELAQVFAGTSVEQGWNRFLTKYPRTKLVSLSAMGFSRDGRQGLVYVCFPGWYGSYYLVTKGGEGWRIAEELGTCIS